MPATRTEILPLRSSGDIVRVRQTVRSWAAELGFSLVDQTKMVTATSELARNTLDHGGGGCARLEVLSEAGRRGVMVTCEDTGPGIPDIQLALQDGYTTRSGLGLGLGGARRLVNEFRIDSQPGVGTRVVIVRWR
jgi:serine/threonine-protein kinase RsbT